MFKAEANMTKPVIQWMKSLGLIVKSEFITPWGMCDLVGLSFRNRSVNHRLRLRQTQSISSLTRAALLLRIPEAEKGKSVTQRTLVREFASVVSKEIVMEHTQQLIEQGFVIKSSSDRLQKLNGWAPLHKRLIAVELKLNRIEEVMAQARNNQSFAEESYVGLPKDVALRVLAKRARWESSLETGVGLLAVSPRSCEVLIRPRRTSHLSNDILKFCAIEKFWRSYSKGS